MKRMHLFVAVILWLAVLPSQAQVTVAAAADLNAALNQIATTYQKQTGREVRLTFGASGNLFNQIQNGAPFDIFFSADMDYPKKLSESGLADPDSLYRYAVGRLVLWVPASSSLDVEHRGMQVLLESSVEKIAIANPEHAPYGRAAVAALRHFDLYDQISKRLVFGESVSQAAQFVESGNAQAGLVAMAHAAAPAMKGNGRYWVVPSDAYPELNQGVVIVSRSTRKDQAREFLDYVKSAAGGDALRQFGFEVPEAKP